MTTALEMIDISKRFGAVTALDRAHLRVERGTMHALLGENGAGKTTLMRVLFGTVKADGGTIRLGEESARVASPADAIRLGIGMVHQHPMHVPTMSVLENMQIGRTGQLDLGRARSSAEALARDIGFSVDLSTTVEQLPVAAQQRVEILKALGRGAQTLILDEPTAVLAPDEAGELLGWLKRFALNGGTVIVITHKLEEARTFADAVTVLRGGQTVLERSSSESSTGDLVAAMLGVESAEPSAVADVAPASTSSGATVASAANLVVPSHHRRVAIGGATFGISAGEVLGVVGLEGSGHHELLQALAGRLSPLEGTLNLPRSIGFVPEDRHRDAVVLNFSLTENIAIRGSGRRRGRLAWRRLAQETIDIIDRFDVRAAGPAARMVSLSGGNQQKLVVGRELRPTPELLVLENPTRGLDIRASRFVHDEIRRARRDGIAIVFYSSDLDEVIALADRLLAVHAGIVRSIPRDRTSAGRAMLGLS